jgi:hypothetical protein
VLNVVLLQGLFDRIDLGIRECVPVEDFNVNGGKLIETDVLDWTRNLEEIHLEPVINV